MRKDSTMFVMAVWLVLALFACAMLMNSLFATDRIVLLITAALVGCVYMLCQSRVERAHAPLIIRDELPEEKSIPPLCKK